MIPRSAQLHITQLLQQFPAVAILGPRQVGKTTLARKIASDLASDSLYLDLERPSDLIKLQEPELYLMAETGKLIIIDEIQRMPGLFEVLRSVIDERRHQGYKYQQFLLLGSASLELLQQSSETLAGRIVYQELTGLTLNEIPASIYTLDQLWLRGGFPESFLAHTDNNSVQWRQAFIRTYLERDIPQLGPKIASETLRRFWTMLAHEQASLLNANRLATNLSISSKTIHRYLDLLVDLLLVRCLRPWSNNVGKRLVKTPKIFIRDSGLTHALLDIRTKEDLLGHPVVGGSWEGFVIENLLAALPSGTPAWFYRTSTGAEIDLILEFGSNKRIAIEIKRSLAPKLSPGFFIACNDIQATHRYVVYAGLEEFKLSNDIEVISVQGLISKLSTLT
jgi:predicted AAA+ superfamily ATPase